MSLGWSGPDPVAQLDAAVSYELGTDYLATSDITINKVRVWSAASHSLVGRKGRIWSAAGALLGSATMSAILADGWTEFSLDAPVVVSASTRFWVTYSTFETYGARTGITYPVVSADTLVAAQRGGFNLTPGQLPNNFSPTAFYGIDVDYVSGAGGNQRPVAGITAVATAALTASATLTIQDETPATVTYVVEWGDGQSSTVSTLGPHVHAYAAAGTYAIMVTATDAGGLTDSAVCLVTVVAAPGLFAPNSELVAVRWLQGVGGITAAQVATTLPRDNSTWAASGFVRVDSIVGGALDPETGYRSPVVSVTLWAANPSSGRPPWWKAIRLGELIVADAAPPNRGHRLLTCGAGYRNARVMGVVPREPRRTPGDPGAYAKYQMDLTLSWAVV